MRKYLSIAVLFISALLFTSCDALLYAQTPTVTVSSSAYGTSIDVSYSTVVTYGTPYYVDGVLSYYLYNDIYYYPYLYDNCWYVHPYRYVQPRGYVHRPPHNFVPEPRYRRPDNFMPRHDPHHDMRRPEPPRNDRFNGRPNNNFNNNINNNININRNNNFNHNRPSNNFGGPRTQPNMNSSSRNFNHGGGGHHMGGGRR